MTTNAESGPNGEIPEPPLPAGTPAPAPAVPNTRTGYAWIGLLIAAIIGIVLLIFILQNLEQAQVDVLFWNFSMPLGITVLLSVIGGALVMGLVGGARMLQMRHAAKKSR
ncbi:LapA family protein [Nocardia camponoti]|uniref:Lipopolysaccharide assembly protein A domain-containing protein n=1 Tax=Nocardia camponoti TaxID=1616106 RepID=A0A917V5H0_9NOCA|nr:lipopolysaccharide assembly protein LapA domain-containing protein [Nocardia camponoti]GGK42629.1 hypothetical protein GCM10011591_12830 [Nocardia camponoti]